MEAEEKMKHKEAFLTVKMNFNTFSGTVGGHILYYKNVWKQHCTSPSLNEYDTYRYDNPYLERRNMRHRRGHHDCAPPTRKRQFSSSAFDNILFIIVYKRSGMDVD